MKCTDGAKVRIWRIEMGGFVLIDDLSVDELFKM